MDELETGYKKQTDKIRPKYENNFLDQVIFRIDFTKEVEDSQSLRSKFTDRIKDVFVEVEEEKLAGFKATLTDNKFSFVKEPPTSAYKYFDQTRKTILTLAPQALALELHSCKKSKELQEVLQLIIDEFKRAYGKETLVKRVGLRYIYIIKDLQDKPLPNGVNPFDWHNLINEDLIPPIDFVERSGIFRAMNLVELNKYKYKVKFQSGLFNSESPNPIGRKEFVLDYDCYSDDERGIGSVMKLIKDFNDEILDLFEASIEDGLRTAMGVIEDEE